MHPAPAGTADQQDQLAQGRGPGKASQGEHDQRPKAAQARRHANDQDDNSRHRRPQQALEEQLTRGPAPWQHGRHGHQEQQAQD